MSSKEQTENRLNVVLVEPEIPQNTGNIARTCAATGTRLHLIKPLGFEISDRYLKRAGLDYWKYLDLSVYENLNEFFEKNSGNFFFLSTKAQNLYTEVKFSGDTYLFFGKETAGLDEGLLKANKEFCLRLPMLESIRSLNLSNSVAITVYEVLRQWKFQGFTISGCFPK
ncbi:MAG: tRNA (cytidine(34)-2'-O)-methyltransferase [Ruminococcaceae bacterium]|nr:tRNA (cytidine(34)-2'-O)-methyltransferase [Oscillospiraceae bacterium]